MTVEHRRTGRQAELVSKDDTKVKVRYLDEAIPEDKRDFEMTVSTYKRWWKPFEEEPGTALANEIANDFEAEEQKEKELTDDQYAEIGKEIAEQAKQKAECTVIVLDNTKSVLELLNTYKQLTIKTYDANSAMKNYVIIKNGNRAVMELVFCKKWVNVRVKEAKLSDVPHKTLKNYYLPAEIKCDYVDIHDTIKTLLKEED